MNRKGFTLIELLVVISIISVLASVVLASLNTARSKAKYGSSKYLQAQLDHSLGDAAIGGWDFDECTGSSTANRFAAPNAGILTNTPTWNSTETPNGTGCSLGFNGTNQYVTAGDIGGFSTNFSVSVWVYKTTPFSGSAEWTILGKRNTSSAGYHLGVTSASNLIWRTFNGGTQVSYTLPKILVTGQWYNILITHTNLNVNVYINGQLEGGGSLGVNPGIDGTAFTMAYIGIGSGGSYWDGLLDGVRIYNTVLSSDDAKRLYAEESHRFKNLVRN